jgi:hypothetical protein
MNILKFVGVFDAPSKFEKLHYLHFGLRLKGLETAASESDKGQEMFLNFRGTAFSDKYFTLKKFTEQDINLNADFNFITQFTQKYRNASTLTFNHQFAIGKSFTLDEGYQNPLKNGFGLVASFEYDWASRQGEVHGKGDQQFRSSNFGVQSGLIFFSQA